MITRWRKPLPIIKPKRWCWWPYDDVYDSSDDDGNDRGDENDSTNYDGNLYITPSPMTLPMKQPKTAM